MGFECVKVFILILRRAQGRVILDDKMPTTCWNSTFLPASWPLAVWIFVLAGGWTLQEICAGLLIILILSYCKQWLCQCSVILSFLCKLHFAPPWELVVQHQYSGCSHPTMVHRYTKMIKANCEKMSQQSITSADWWMALTQAGRWGLQWWICV